MKNLAIIGAKGMIGSDLVRYLGNEYQITQIHRENYGQQKGKKFDIVINANGNSRRYWANTHPFEDFIASTVSVFKSIFDFSCKTYIYISSPDVYPQHDSTRITKETEPIDPKNLEAYGFHKYLSELIVQKNTKKFLILRCSLMLGKKLTKGPFYDILNDKPLFITNNSRLQVITTRAVAEVIAILLKKSVVNQIINVGGTGTFVFSGIGNVRTDAVKQVYEMNIEKVKQWYPTLKRSDAYVRSIIPL